ncbi:hypothetical protein M9Y10_041356 [Tritrichomonas musculus]|uniref:Uncharacterized protein n=1 Tax=Tritrichomonas musculus TaxID=1915356 RepID=A0ABR2K441_9EUKA
MSTSDQESSFQFSDDEAIGEQKQELSYQSALLLSRPFEFLNANFDSNNLPESQGTYCAFCGKLLSKKAETCFPCSCRNVSSTKTTASQILNQQLGPFPQRRTPPLSVH